MLGLIVLIASGQQATYGQKEFFDQVAFSKRTTILGYQKWRLTNSQQDPVAGGRFYNSVSAIPEGRIDVVSYFRGEFPFPGSAGDTMIVSCRPSEMDARVHVRINDLGQSEQYGFQIDLGLSPNSELRIPFYVKGLEEFMSSPVMGILARPTGKNRQCYYPVQINKVNQDPGNRLIVALLGDIYLERIDWKLTLQPGEEVGDEVQSDQLPNEWHSITRDVNGTPIKNTHGIPLLIDLGTVPPGLYLFSAKGYGSDAEPIHCHPVHLIIDPIRE